MDNLLKVSTRVHSTLSWSKLDYGGSVFRLRFFGKPNGDAISVQLHQRFAHVTRG